MSDYTYKKSVFITGAEKIAAEFHTTIKSMDLDNVSVEDEMIEAAEAISQAAADAKDTLARLG